MKRVRYKNLTLLLTAFGFLMSGCGDSTTIVGGGGGAGAGPTTTISLSGTVSVSSTDLSLASPLSRSMSRSLTSNLVNPAEVAAPSFTVTVTKVNADGTEEAVSGVTATTDSSGAYTLTGLPPAVTGTGAATDFYYRVTATSGDVVIASPVAPTADTSSVEVNPQTNLASTIISQVVDPQTGSGAPTPPDASTINALRELVEKDAGTDLASSITIPSVTDAAATLAMANGLSAAGGDAEKMFKATQFESESLELLTSLTATDEQAGSYIKRLVREACDQSTTINPLPILAANVMGEAFRGGITFTPTQIVDAWNTVSGQSIAASTLVSSVTTILTAIEADYSSATASDGISNSEQLLLYAKKNLSSATFSTTTALTADQAVLVIQLLSQQPTLCDLGSVDITKVIAALTASTTLGTPAIKEVQIYHNSGFGCDQNANEGHFMADVTVYIPRTSLLTVSSVTIQSSQTDSLDADPADGSGTGLITLTPAGSHYMSNTDGVCVVLGESVTYTVTATLSDASTISTTATRNHPLVPEATTTLSGTSLSGSSSSPTAQPDKRPTFTWLAPDTVLASISDAPAGSQIKYTYEFAHMLVGGGGPISSSTACPSVNAGALYSVDNFMPTEDCQIDLCATAQGVATNQIACRINVQTYLVDEYDNLLGQAAGNFRFVCVDTNGDNDCGE